MSILGAESTGKTTLASEVAQQLQREGHDVALVSEYLREFCDTHGRTPLVHEQAGIAAEQARRIASAAQTHELVIADTSALTIAVYSEQVFGDTSLYGAAIEAQRVHALTLLMALDLPWVADGLQRDGPHVRAPTDALLRAALQRGGIGYTVVSGSGAARSEAALRAVRHALQSPSALDEVTANPPWRRMCERCGDGDCERHAFLLPRGR